MPPDLFTIFLDENHCNNRRLLQTLENSGVPFVRHVDQFARGTEDELWLPLVGKNGWALLTTDKRIRYRTNERLAIQRHKVRMFYFSTNEFCGLQMALALERGLPRMRRLYEKQDPPFCAAVTRSGEVHLTEVFKNT